MKSKYYFIFSILLFVTLTACTVNNTTNNTTGTTEQTTINTTTNSSTSGTATNTTVGTTTSTTVATTTTTTINTTTSTTNPNLSNDCEVVKEGFTLTFCDAFNGEGNNLNTLGVDLDKWAFQLGTGSQYGLNGWGNNEQQYYREENIKAEDGKLIIEAKKQSYGGKDYTSGRLYTDPTFTQTYGRFEASIKMPAGQGFWPAFWMMPKNSVYGGWAASGEIDIMEAKGRLTNQVGGTIHYGSQWPNNMHTGKTYYFPAGQNIMEFHEYAVEWEPGELRWYVDGKLFQTLTNWHSNDNPFPAPFDQDFYIILNLAVGGTYDGNLLPEDNMLPATMEVEYVRVYEFNYEDDTTPPSSISNLKVTSNLPEKSIIEWTKATDNNRIGAYEVYLNNQLIGKTLDNKYTVANLTSGTQYNFSVIPVDLAGNKGEEYGFSFTPEYPNNLSKIEAEHYVQMNGIQVQSTSDIGGGQNVGYIDLDDFMTYKVNILEEGTYKIKYRIASQSNGGTIALNIDNLLINQTTFNATGGWQTWRDAESETFTLTSGVKTIKLVAAKEGFNINWFEIIKVE